MHIDQLTPGGARAKTKNGHHGGGQHPCTGRALCMIFPAGENGESPEWKGRQREPCKGLCGFFVMLECIVGNHVFYALFFLFTALQGLRRVYGIRPH